MSHSSSRARIYEAIDRERDAQDRKWGSQRKQSPFNWVAILTEEVGETAEATLKGTEEHLLSELVQVAAVAVCWLEALAEEVEGVGDDQN